MATLLDYVIVVPSEDSFLKDAEGLLQAFSEGYIHVSGGQDENGNEYVVCTKEPISKELAEACYEDLLEDMASV